MTDHTPTPAAQLHATHLAELAALAQSWIDSGNWTMHRCGLDLHHVVHAPPPPDDTDISRSRWSDDSAESEAAGS